MHRAVRTPVGRGDRRFRVARGIGLLVFAAVALAIFAGALLELLEHPLADVQRGMQGFRDAYYKTPYADEVRDRETLQQLFLKLNDTLAEADPEPLKIFWKALGAGVEAWEDATRIRVSVTMPSRIRSWA
jgi:hypothetical protein